MKDRIWKVTAFRCKRLVNHEPLELPLSTHGLWVICLDLLHVSVQVELIHETKPQLHSLEP